VELSSLRSLSPAEEQQGNGQQRIPCSTVLLKSPTSAQTVDYGRQTAQASKDKRRQVDTSQS
jgi:hypothetical protein